MQGRTAVSLPIADAAFRRHMLAAPMSLSVTQAARLRLMQRETLGHAGGLVTAALCDDAL